MRRFRHITILVAIAGLTACSGPIETRIDTAMPVAPASGSTYFLSVPEGDAAPIQSRAAALLEPRLTAVGLTRTSDPEAAKYVVSLGVADRSADFGYQSGGQVIAMPKKKRALQSCVDREYRVTVAIMQVSDGAESYRGSAAEYHCKASLDDILPTLVDAALSGFTGQTGPRVELRQGVD